MRARRLAFVFALTLLGCGGPESGSGQQARTSGAESEAELEGFDMEGFDDDGEPRIDHGSASARELLGIHPPEQPWAQMSYADKEMHMVAYVLPIHAEIFAEYDRSEYAAFDCASCHGADGPERRYAMPSRGLPPLPQPGTPAWTAASQRNPRMWAFMEEQVMPTMRTQLGQPDATCFSCHQRRD